MFTATTHSPSETKTLARRIGLACMPGDVLLLHGDLGAGKTTFIQGLAQGLGISEVVTSPTYTLIQEYLDGRLPLFHLDPYRLGCAEEVADLGFEEYLERGGVVVVEWAERLDWLTPAEHLSVSIVYSSDERRRIQLTAHGTRYSVLLTELGVNT